MGVETGLPSKLPSLARVNLSLTDTDVSLLSLRVLPPRSGGGAPGVNLMASRVNVQCLTIKTLLASDATWGAIRVTFWNASQAKTVRGNVHLQEYLWRTLHIFLTTIRLV